MSGMESRSWMERALRARPVGSGLAGCLVLGLAACGAHQPAGAPPVATGPVPWVSTGGAKYQPPPGVQAATPCRGSDLKVVVENVGGYNSTSLQNVLLVDQGPAACFLATAPRWRVVMPDGSRRNVNDSGGGRYDLLPGDKVQVGIGSQLCPSFAAGPSPAGMEMILPSGDVVQVSGMHVSTACGNPELVVYEDQSEHTPPPVPASALKATLSAVGPAQRGGTLSYVVTITNPTVQAIDLHPCPSYSEAIGSGGPSVERTLLLNCAAVPSVAAGATVDFQIELPIPSDFPAGGTKLGWRLEVPDGPVAGQFVRVT